MEEALLVMHSDMNRYEFATVPFHTRDVDVMSDITGFESRPLPLKEEPMARTSTRRWKGCQLCKPHKHDANGQSVRQPWAVLRKTGKKRKVSRHDLGDQD